ncbi:hypothetical protein OROGR_001887 [Orobanche gracilis]
MERAFIFITSSSSSRQCGEPPRLLVDFLIGFAPDGKIKTLRGKQTPPAAKHSINAITNRTILELQTDINMHSLGHRVNALVVLAVTILALICGIASFSDNFNSISPSAEVHVLDINRFRKKLTGDDEVFVFLAAEYETPKNGLNQVSLWDSILPSKELAKFQIRTTNKYRFIDQGSNLRGKDFNLTMHWHVMPKTGKMLADNLVISGFRLPEAYK